MRKYIETVKILFKSQLAYRFDIIMNIVLTVSKMLLAYVLWSAVFETQDIVAGFTLNSMMSYYIISSFVAQLDQATGTGWHIAEDIRNGSFSKYIIKPMDTFGYFTAHTAGVSLFLLIFNLLAAILWVLIFGVEFSMTNDVLMILQAVVLILLGLLFMVQLSYFIGILAFKVLDVTIFMLIKDNISEFVKGSLIPLTLLSPAIIGVMKLFPFYYVTYLPTMLLLGRNGNEALQGILILVCWIVLFRFINLYTFKRLRHRYDGVGI